MNLNDMPHLILTDAAGQLEQAESLCRDCPVILEYHHRQMVLMPYSYFQEQFCTAEERARLNAEIETYIRGETR